ncbi:MAG TPA: hypothetical protein VGI05_18710 [Streptosporangiaceae bacterium]
MSPGNFDWQVTANIYAADSSGKPTTLLATSGPVTQTIPYRPAADSTGHCLGLNPDGSDSPNRWWNPNAIGGAGHCQSSIAKVLTFNFAPVVLPDHVVWTVAFNTSTAGYHPVGLPCPAGSFPGLVDGGCPYDSLNVGDNGNTGGAGNPGSFISGAPYAGTDALLGGGAVINQLGSGLHLESSGPAAPAVDGGWAGLRPLGEIITTP